MTPISHSLPEPPDAEPEVNTDDNFPIVGAVASAGGLDAFIELLKHLPVDTGMAFVLIQHLEPKQKSLLSEILAQTTQMPVIEVQDGMIVEPNQIYIIPPATKMVLSNGVLRLSPREKIYGRYLPGDAFFTSLAAERASKAIGVVLSGGDGDGALGMKAIKTGGGLTFAQCEETAKVEDMPHTSIETGVVDFILPPKKIAEELARLSHHLFISEPFLINSVADSSNNDNLALIFTLLKSATGVDFTYYKPKTIGRRIQRRMLLHKRERLEDYVRYLQENPAEIKELHEEILINVTSFFRDSEAFQQLKEQVFPTITENKSADASIRIWVAGCSTGEEVYSLAICLLESLTTEKATRLSIQIFGTDISNVALEKARSGIYQENQMLDISPERRQKYFIKLEYGCYQIRKNIRELCIFARQDLGSDPPFSNIDMISCRNVLIYLGETWQKRIIPIFHYSLNSTGFLLLGTSESTGQFSNLFTVVDSKYKIYRKKITAQMPTFSFLASNHWKSKVDSTKPINPTRADDFNLEQETEQMILNRYAPVGVVINDKMEVLQLRGDTNPYLRLAPGKVSFNLFQMVREDLLVDLRATIYQAQRQDVVVKKEGLQIEEGNQSKIVNLEVLPFKTSRSEERYFLVLFKELTPPVRNLNLVNLENVEQSDLEREIVRLRQELMMTKNELAETHSYLQAVTQEQEYTHQDLKVANEEILSSNEELQSTNEELETAKEELQATNEELNTTNEELRSRNLELHAVNNDLTNLLASINIPILMLTNDLRVRRFTPMAHKLFNFIPADIGRPFSDIRSNFNLVDLESLILEVIDTLTPKDLEIQTQAGYWYNARIHPYRTTENKIEGAVVVLIDIDALKRSAATLEAARNYAESIVETVQVPLLVLDPNLHVNRANRSFYETFQVSSRETVQSSIFELMNGEGNSQGLRSLFEEVLANNTKIQNFEVKQSFEKIGQKTILLNGSKIVQEAETEMLLLWIQDITEEKLFEAERSQLLTHEQLARQQAETANQAKDEFLSNLSHELRNPLNTILGWAQILRKGSLKEATVASALEVIERSARTQNQLIEDLLDVSRINSGKLRLNTHLIDFALVARVGIESIQVAAEAKTIQIVSQLNSALIMGDVARLQQVLSNILSNAVKFTPAGGRIEITLALVQNYAELLVSDTGKGISADLLPYVFDRFRQGDASSSKASQGLGLGLSIVHHIVELHNGTVKAESPGEGQGTTITVRLPLHEMHSEITLPNSLELNDLSESDVLSDELPSLAGLQILVVDNEVSSCDLVKWILEKAGAEVVAVTSARDAIAALTETPGRFDVLLSDIGMPDEDGYWLIRQVREFDAEAGRKIPAAAITAYGSDRDRQKVLDAGFQTHLAKPIDPAQLVLIVAQLVGITNAT